jgi:hypothetical protein
LIQNVHKKWIFTCYAYSFFGFRRSQ